MRHPHEHHDTDRDDLTRAVDHRGTDADVDPRAVDLAAAVRRAGGDAWAIVHTEPDETPELTAHRDAVLAAHDTGDHDTLRDAWRIFLRALADHRHARASASRAR